MQCQITHRPDTRELDYRKSIAFIDNSLVLVLGSARIQNSNLTYSFDLLYQSCL